MKRYTVYECDYIGGSDVLRCFSLKEAVRYIKLVVKHSKGNRIVEDYEILEERWYNGSGDPVDKLDVVDTFLTNVDTPPIRS